MGSTLCVDQPLIRAVGFLFDATTCTGSVNADWGHCKARYWRKSMAFYGFTLDGTEVEAPTLIKHIPIYHTYAIIYLDEARVTWVLCSDGIYWDV